MPFCIIFLTLCIVYICVFGLRNKTIDFAIIAICLGLISSLFFGDCKIGEGIVINIPFVTSIIAILSVFLKQSYLSDVCIIYVLISFLSVVVLSNVFINRYIEEHKATNIIPTIEEDNKKEEKEDEK